VEYARKIDASIISVIRKSAFLVLQTVLCLAVFLCYWSLCAAQEKRVVTVGVYENAPKIFTSESGAPVGIFIDIIKHIAAKEGWELRYMRGSWGEGLDRLERGEIDLMPDVAYAPDREKIYSFHKIPVLSAWYQIYAQRGSGVRSMLDLNNKRILVLERSVQHDAFARLSKGFGLNSVLIPSPDYASMFEVVARGEADAAIVNRFYGMAHAARYGLEDTGIVFEPSDLFFAISRKAPHELSEAIDRNLDAMKRDSESTYYSSLKRWTAEDVRFKFPAWLKIAVFVAGLMLLMSLAGIYILKHQVKIRTRELQARERHYRYLFEQNPAPMLIYERETLRLLAVNDVFTMDYGYNKEEISSMCLPDLYPEEEKESVVSLARRLSGHAYVGEWHHIRKDGAVITVVARSHDIPYEGRSARIAVVTDITEQKKTEDALRQTEEKFIKAFYASPDSITISRMSDGILIDVNDMFLRNNGYLREEVLNRSSLELNLWASPHDRELYVTRMKEEGNVRDMEAQFRKKSGAVMDGIVSGESIMLGADQCLITIMRDVTEQKKIDKELERSRMHLEELVNERTVELKAKISEIERINRLFVDRELRMIELKERIRELEREEKP
jgi:PAS domain S-box-containing protein